MSQIEFRGFPKIPRLYRGMVVTEKLDGTNAGVIVHPLAAVETWNTLAAGDITPDAVGTVVETDLGLMIVAAQSRKRLVKPGKSTDNAGFAGWVRTNAQGLAETLGDGWHYGEWWGAQNARKALKQGEQKLSLFNVSRHADADLSKVPGLGLVPVLHEGPFKQHVINMIVEELRERGSVAHPDVPAEGVIVFMKSSGHAYKVLCHNDELPKGVAEVGYPEK